MSSDREIMQRALEAMLESREVGPYADDDCLSEAITALRERLSRCDRCGKPSGEAGHIHTCSPQVTEPYCDDCGGTDPECPLKVEHTKKYVTEPVAVVKTLSMGEGKPPFHYIECRHLPEGTPLYTAPNTKVNSEAIPEQISEPVAWVDDRIHGWPDCIVMEPDGSHTKPLYTAPQRRDSEQPEQEPFAEVRLNMTGGNAGLSTRIVQIAEGYYPAGTKLYTAPQRREWVGLTDEEADELIRRFARYELLRAIEQVLKEKNTCPT